MNKIRSVIVGCGAIFENHAISISECKEVELVAVCDIIEERAKAKAEKYNCAYYTDYKVMLKEVKPDCLHICLPHYLHSEVAIYALEKGVNVLTEKPLAITVEEADKMLEAQKKSGKTLACIFQNRFNAGPLLVKKLIKDGTLGKVKGARSLVMWKRTDAYYEQDAWRGTLKYEGGGVVINQAIHTLDLMRFLIDEPIVKVECNLGKRSDMHIEVEDYAEGYIEFESGVKGLFNYVNYYSFDDSIEVDIDCENGRAKIVLDTADVKLNDGRTFHAEPSPDDFISYDGAKNYWGMSHIKQIKDFYKHILTGSEMYVTLESAYETTKVVDMIYKHR